MELLGRAGPTSTVLSPDRARVAAYDLEGRLLTYYQNGSFFKRSLASELFERHRSETTRWRRVEPKVRLRLFGEAADLAREVLRGATDPTLGRRLEGILEWTPERLLDESRRFDEVYFPVSILPPDRYLSIVLQATRGCTWNRCTFCNFYQDRPFSALSGEDFRRHAEGVAALLGRDVARRRGIFLADGNALSLSPRRLVEFVEVAAELFPQQPIWGFVDLFGGERQRPETWPALRERHLAGVYVGMETGLDELLAFVDKPGSCDQLVAFVGELKAARLAVGLIVMVGLGGRENRDRHRQASLEALAAMPLDGGDVVFLSPFVEHTDSRYARQRVDAGLTPMTWREVECELEVFAETIRARGMRASRYDIREFVY